MKNIIVGILFMFMGSLAFTQTNVGEKHNKEMIAITNNISFNLNENKLEKSKKIQDYLVHKFGKENKSLITDISKVDKPEEYFSLVKEKISINLYKIIEEDFDVLQNNPEMDLVEYYKQRLETVKLSEKEYGYYNDMVSVAINSYQFWSSDDGGFFIDNLTNKTNSSSPKSHQLIKLTLHDCGGALVGGILEDLWVL